MKIFYFFLVGVCAVQAFSPSAYGAYEKGDSWMGEILFVTNCSKCHSVDAWEENKVGPNLYGVFGRRSGEVSGFNYSNAMRYESVVWDGDTLYDYLENPQIYLAGTKDRFAGFNSETERNDLIAYLRKATQ